MDITMKWHSALCVMMLLSGKNARPDSAFTGINTLIREYIGRTTSSDDLQTTQDDFNTLAPDLTDSTRRNTGDIHSTLLYQNAHSTVSEKADPYRVQHAALPRGVAVYPVPLRGSDHELMFNVTWDPPVGPEVREYSLEVHSLTDTRDCRSNLCYEYNIPGESLWSVIPAFASPVSEGCAVRPGCAYKVKLIAHPWDGHTAANINVELDECVAGVCSCAHAPRLPVPIVDAHTLSIQGDLFVNITWTLPPPDEPLRLPPRLMKKYYFISLGKQMVSDAHPAPWFANTISRRVDATGFVVVPDVQHWQVLPVTERNSDRGDKSDKHMVKLLARVSLVDERGCIGQAGNTTAYDPAKIAKSTVGTFALWAAFGGACVLAVVVILAFSARAVKRVLNEFRPTSVSAPLQPMAHRPLWFPLGT
ncbi:unnamed protein product, partial [Brenthis ino]